MERLIGAHVSASGGPQNAIKNAISIYANCLQIFAGSPRMWSRSLYSTTTVSAYHQVNEVSGNLPLFIHALYLVNLGSDNPSLVEKSINALEFDLKNGDLLNAQGVIIHIGSHQQRGFDSVKNNIAAILKDLLSVNKTTPILLENSSNQKGKIGTLDELSFFLEHIDHPRLGVCLDTAHLYESGYDLNNQKETDNLIKTLKEKNILDRVRCIHLNGSKTKLGSTKDEHSNLSEGEIALEGLSYFINQEQLSALPIILEVPGFDNNGPDAKNIEIAKSLVN